MNPLSIDWCINCAYGFTGKSIKRKMFADIFVRIAKSIENKNEYFHSRSNEFVIDSSFFHSFVKNQSCIEKFWFKKGYWKFFVGMISTSYTEENLFLKKCRISFNNEGRAFNKNGCVTFKFY